MYINIDAFIANLYAEATRSVIVCLYVFKNYLTNLLKIWLILDPESGSSGKQANFSYTFMFLWIFLHSILRIFQCKRDNPIICIGLPLHNVHTNTIIGRSN